MILVTISFIILLNCVAGPQAMVQAGASYAGITYMLDLFLGGGGRGKTIQNGEYVDDEFGREEPVDIY